MAAFVTLGQAGTSVRGAYTVLVEMMVVATLLPFVPLFGAAIKLSAGAPVPGEVRIPGGRLTVGAMALIGLVTTLGAIALGSCRRRMKRIRPLPCSRSGVRPPRYWWPARRLARLTPKPT